MSFTDIIASEYQASGPAILYSGFPAHLLSTFAVQAFIYTVIVSRPLDRFLLWLQVPRRTKLSLQRFKAPLDSL